MPWRSTVKIVRGILKENSIHALIVTCKGDKNKFEYFILILREIQLKGIVRHLTVR